MSDTGSIATGHGPWSAGETPALEQATLDEKAAIDAMDTKLAHFITDHNITPEALERAKVALEEADAARLAAEASQTPAGDPQIQPVTMAPIQVSPSGRGPWSQGQPSPTEVAIAHDQEALAGLEVRLAKFSAAHPPRPHEAPRPIAAVGVKENRGPGAARGVADDTQ